MAVDGTLKFDTKIDTDGIENGSKSVKDVIQKLIRSLENLATVVTKAFNGIDVGDVSTEVQQVEQSVDSAKESIIQMANDTVQATEIAETSVNELGDALDNITITRWNDLESEIYEVADVLEEVENQAIVTAQAINDITTESKEISHEVNKIDDAQIEEMNESSKELNNMLNLIRSTFQSIPGIVSIVGERIKNAFSADAEIEDTKNDIQQLVNKIDTYEDALISMEGKGLYFGDEEYDKAYIELTRMEQKLKEYKKGLTSVDGEQKKVSKSADKASKDTNKAGNSMKNSEKKAGRFSKTLRMLGKSLMFSMVFRAFSAITNAVREGMQNLAQYSPLVNKSMSALATSMLTLKNSFVTGFSPILTAVTPALQTLINYLSQAITTMGQFFAVLLNGSTTFIKAKDAQIDYAKSLKKTAKEANNTLSPIDKLNNVGDSGSSSAYEAPKPSQMFEEVEIDSKFIDTINTFKESLATIFEPIKTSWDMYGEGAINSAKGAFNGVVEVIKTIGSSFASVWTNGTGTQIIDNILIIFTNINDTIKNIAKNFKTAWENNGTGTKVIQDILDVVNNLLKGFKDITQATKDWASELDFSPILTSFQNLTSALEPLSGTIADGLSWFYKNVLLPLAGWVITDILPLFLDGLAAVLGIINGVLEALKPLGLWLFDNFLKPLAEWTGGVVVDVLGWIVEKLQSFSDWINDNQGAVETFTIIIGSFMAVWGVVSLATSIAGIVTALATFVATGGLASVVAGALSAAIAFITSPVTIVIAIIGALIAIVVLLIKNWDVVKEKAIEIWGAISEWFKTTCENIGSFFSGLWESIKIVFSIVGAWFKAQFVAAVTNIKNAFSEIGKWFGERWTNIKDAFANVGTWFKDMFTTAWTNIKTIFSLDSVKGFFDGIWSGIQNCFSNVSTWFKDTFSEAWKKVKEVFSSGGKIFDGIKDGIVSTFKTVVNALIGGINKVISIPFNAINGMLNKIRNVEILGINPFKSFWSQSPLSVPQIPKLATGAVIPPNSEFLAILGDQKKGTNIEAPLSTIEEAVANVLGKTGGTNGDINLTINLDGKTVFNRMVKLNQEYTDINGKSAFGTT